MRHFKLACLALALTASSAGASIAGEKVPVIASFSILGDIVANVGGDRIALKTIVGPDGDAHVYQPTPTDAAAVTKAKAVFINGVEFEGWIERLIEASGYKGPIFTASKGVRLLETEDDDEHEEHADHKDHGEHKEHADHDEHDVAKKEKGHDDHHHGEHDPHAWHDAKRIVAYIANVKDGLCKVDVSGCEVYTRNAAAFTRRVEAVDTEVRRTLSKIAEDKRKVISSHDAFGYFSSAYGVTILAPQGLSTESEASAADVAKLIDLMRKEGTKAVFVENVSDPRLIQQIARETGAKIGGRLYSDALSKADGPASTYIDMMRHNAMTMATALAGS